jgi:hypothetical protein
MLVAVVTKPTMLRALEATLDAPVIAVTPHDCHFNDELNRTQFLAATGSYSVWSEVNR